MKVALFATCIGDIMFPDAVAATAKVLTRLGCEVIFPTAQKLLRADACQYRLSEGDPSATG